MQNLRFFTIKLLVAAIVIGSPLLLQAQRLSKYSSDIQYRMCRVGSSSKKIDRGCFVRLQIFSKSEKGLPDFYEDCWIPIGNDPQKNTFVSALTLLSQGDSAEFVMPTGIFVAGLKNYLPPKDVPLKETMHVYVGVRQVYESDIVFDDSYGQFRNDYAQHEHNVVELYKRRRSFRQVGDVWKELQKQGNGIKLTKSGDAMLINYEGRFLNGELFDAGTKTKDGQPFRYVRGLQWQLVSGLAQALSSMTEGEKAQVILPSRYAFGEHGLLDIVPPFTPVVYDVEVVKVVRVGAR